MFTRSSAKAIRKEGEHGRPIIHMTACSRDINVVIPCLTSLVGPCGTLVRPVSRVGLQFLTSCFHIRWSLFKRGSTRRLVKHEPATRSRSPLKPGEKNEEASTVFCSIMFQLMPEAR